MKSGLFVKDKFGSNDNLQHGHKTMYLVIHSLYSQMFVFSKFIHKKLNLQDGNYKLQFEDKLHYPPYRTTQRYGRI